MTLDERINARALRAPYWYATLMQGGRWVGGIPAWSWRELQRRIAAASAPGMTVRITRQREVSDSEYARQMAESGERAETLATRLVQIVRAQ